MDLKIILKALPPGEQVSLKDIARKVNLTESAAEKAILEIIDSEPTLGSFNAFTQVFIRSGQVTAMPGAGIADGDLGETVATRKQAFVDSDAVPANDDAMTKSTATERVIQRTNSILALVGRIGGLIEGKEWNDIDLSTLSASDRAGLHEALDLLVAKEDKEGGQRQFPGTATLWFQAGVVADKLGWPREAARFYNASLALDPNNAFAWNNLGLVVSDNKEAERCYRKALDLDPKLAMAWFGLGNMVTDNTNKEQYYRKAVELDPKYAEAWTNLGTVVADKVEAERCFMKAVELDPKYAKAWVNLGIVIANRTEQERILRKAVALDPNLAIAWFTLGTVVKDKAEEERCYRKALELDPKSPRPWNNLGVVLTNPAEKEQCYRKALELNAMYALAWANLGKLLTDRAEKERCFRKAVEADPKLLKAWVYLEDVVVDEAEKEQCQRKVIELTPKDAKWWADMGNKIRNIDLGQALYCWEQAAALGHKESKKQADKARKNGAQATPPF